uniref:Uncharacterized protein n=1 Tax=Ananas comosus var. bracteatus TaxID=296719 RepID=A0A6V7P8N5_ANACO|nr:unnamed protein product [Ananas comosus var. bracteatus]
MHPPIWPYGPSPLALGNRVVGYIIPILILPLAACPYAPHPGGQKVMASVVVMVCFRELLHDVCQKYLLGGPRYGIPVENDGLISVYVEVEIPRGESVAKTIRYWGSPFSDVDQSEEDAALCAVAKLRDEYAFEIKDANLEDKKFYENFELMSEKEFLVVERRELTGNIEKCFEMLQRPSVRGVRLRAVGKGLMKIQRRHRVIGFEAVSALLCLGSTHRVAETEAETEAPHFNFVRRILTLARAPPPSPPTLLRPCCDFFFSPPRPFSPPPTTTPISPSLALLALFLSLLLRLSATSDDDASQPTLAPRRSLRRRSLGVGLSPDIGAAEVVATPQPLSGGSLAASSPAPWSLAKRRASSSSVITPPCLRIPRHLLRALHLPPPWPRDTVVASSSQMVTPSRWSQAALQMRGSGRAGGRGCKGTCGEGL